jgi:hypothetical protein
MLRRKEKEFGLAKNWFGKYGLARSQAFRPPNRDNSYPFLDTVRRVEMFLNTTKRYILAQAVR